VGHLQNLGLHTKTAEEVAIQSIKMHREAQKFIGVPADQILRMPKDAGDTAAWTALHAKLGVPSDKAGYDFEEVKFSDGTVPDAKFLELVRDTAANLKLPKDAAPAMAKAMLDYLDGAEKTESAENTAKLALQKDTLAKNWGSNFEANKFVAGQAGRALGVAPETVAALENVIGYDKIMEMFRTIGTKIGEDKFVSGGANSNNSGVMTRDQAIARKVDLKADTAFVKRFIEGDTGARREMEALDRIVSAPR